jgi:hypothetical protein
MFEKPIGPTVFIKDSKIYCGLNYKAQGKFFTNEDLKNFRALVEYEDGRTTFISNATLVEGQVAFDLTDIEVINIENVYFLIWQNIGEQNGEENWRIAKKSSGRYINTRIASLRGLE